jgi:hypothetical protein
MAEGGPVNAPIDLDLSLSVTGLVTLDAGAPQRIAESRYFPMRPGWASRVESLRVVQGSAADCYEVELRDLADHPDTPGWVMCQAGFRWNGVSHDWKPLTFYAGAPTDWPTGLVSWRSVEQWGPGPRGYTMPGPVWQLSVRTRAVAHG